MQYASVLLVLSALLAGCGLTETGAAAADAGATQAQQAAAGRRTQDQVKARIEAANQAAADRERAAADDAAR